MPPTVPFFDPRRENAELGERLDEAIASVLASGRFILGPSVEAFEEAVAAYLGVEHAVGLGSGTDALALALEALGVGAGDEVITTPFSFVATAATIAQAGARPVFVDIRPDTFNLDPATVAAAVSPHTVAMVPVHLFGQMAEMEALRGVADEHGLAIVEDAAQAIGAAWLGPAGEVRRAGSLGEVGCFSFYPTKNLGGMGDGGLAVTSDSALAARLRRLRDHGRADGGRYPELGHNSRLDALQAAVLHAKLERLEEWNERRRAHAAAYDAALASHPSIRPPVVGEGNRHVYHQYTARCGERAETRRRLEEAEVGYAVYYPLPLHLQEGFAWLGYREGDFPEAERAAREALSLPVYPGLTAEERQQVIEALL